ncbi:hypothetical protein LXL04_022194 [Taraxacum kok-saghyz]
MNSNGVDRFIKSLVVFTCSYDAHGIRNCVEAVILLLNQVELFKHPHLLLLQSKNCIYKLPGGRLRPGESGEEQSSLSKLSVDEDCYLTQWEVGTWCKSDFETLHDTYLPESGKNPKVISSNKHDDGTAPTENSPPIFSPTDFRFSNLDNQPSALHLDKDWEDVKFGMDNQVDFYDVSFVKDAEVFHELKYYLKRKVSSL